MHADDGDRPSCVWLFLVALGLGLGLVVRTSWVRPHGGFRRAEEVREEIRS